VTAYEADGWDLILNMGKTLIHSIQISTESYTASCPKGIRGNFTRGKPNQLGQQANSFHPSIQF
jgi:hypothetical protein